MSEHDPADCWFCGQRATGLGIAGRTAADNKWLCMECAVMAEDVRRIRRPDAYKLKARAGGIDAAKPFFAEHGYDMSEWDEEAALMFVGAVWDGCSKRLRELVREDNAPF